MDKELMLRAVEALEDIALELKKINDEGLVILEDFGINEN